MINPLQMTFVRQDHICWPFWKLGQPVRHQGAAVCPRGAATRSSRKPEAGLCVTRGESAGGVGGLRLLPCP